MVAAAQRPLTLDELGEAISITPGDTGWNKSKLVNDILKALESCGSFIVVDEELSTVHFAHSSVKRHLLSEPTDLDVRDYHIDLSRANTNLGNIAVTYLNLDLFNNQLIQNSGPSRTYATNVPSFVVRSALPKHEIVNRMALAILRGRKTTGSDSGPDWERSANLLGENNSQVQEVLSFLPYCQKYWLYHSKNIHESDQGRVYELWNNLLDGTVSTIELPWAPEKQSELGEQFMGWITNNRHIALMRQAIQQLWYNFTKVDFHKYSDASSFWTEQLEQLLRLLPNEDSRPSVYLGPPRIDAMLQVAIREGCEAVVRLLLQEGADVNSPDYVYGNPLHAAVSGNKRSIAELLIKEGADVNLQGGKYGSALQAAAATHGMDPIVKTLLEKGANVNARGGEHGTALMAAAAIDNTATIRLLVNADVDVNACGGKYGTALITAVANDNLAAVYAILEAGSDVNLCDQNGESPLRVAANHGNEHIVKKLLSKGASINKSLTWRSIIPLEK